MEYQIDTLYFVLFRGVPMILRPHTLSSEVYLEDGSKYLTCELGPISEFFIVGEL